MTDTRVPWMYRGSDRVDWDRREVQADEIHFFTGATLVLVRPRCPSLSTKAPDGRCRASVGTGFETCWAHDPDRPKRGRKPKPGRQPSGAAATILAALPAPRAILLTATGLKPNTLRETLRLMQRRGLIVRVNGTYEVAVE